MLRDGSKEEYEFWMKRHNKKRAQSDSFLFNR